MISEETGKLEKQGNIYEDVSTAELMARHPPKITNPEEVMIVSSRGVQHHELTLEPHV